MCLYIICSCHAIQHASISWSICTQEFLLFFISVCVSDSISTTLDKVGRSLKIQTKLFQSFCFVHSILFSLSLSYLRILISCSLKVSVTLCEIYCFHPFQLIFTCPFLFSLLEFYIRCSILSFLFCHHSLFHNLECIVYSPTLTSFCSYNLSFFPFPHLNHSVSIPGGYSVQKRPYGDVPPTWVAESASWYMNDPLENAKFGIWMGRCFKISPNWSQNWLKFKKILEKSGDFAQNLMQNWSNWYMKGSLFLEKLVFVWVYFRILRWNIPTKTKLEYPTGFPLFIDLRILYTCLTCKSWVWLLSPKNLAQQPSIFSPLTVLRFNINIYWHGVY